MGTHWIVSSDRRGAANCITRAEAAPAPAALALAAVALAVAALAASVAALAALVTSGASAAAVAAEGLLKGVMHTANDLLWVVFLWLVRWCQEG